jgi:hypothetical protein
VLWLLALAVERRGRALGGVLVLGAAALLLSTRATGIAFDPLSGGELLRRLVIPYGAPLGVTSTLWITVAVSLRAAWSWWRREDEALRFAWSVAAAVAVAASCTPWSAAGRYLVLPVAAAAIGLAGIPSRRWRRGVLLALLLFHLPAIWGSGARDLRTVARIETSLAHVVRQHANAIGSTILVVDPPRLGWKGSAADLENVVSTALLREVRVQTRSAAPSDGAWLRYAGGHWIFTPSNVGQRR